MENFNEVYGDNHKKVLNYIACNIKEDITIAEELTNDVFMRVHKHLHKYDPKKATVATWVMFMAKNVVIDHYRRKKKLTVSMDEMLDSSKTSDNLSVRSETFINMVSTTNPFKEMVGNEISDIIQNEFLNLPDKYINVADLFFNDQCTYEEISKTLNIPLGTVKIQLNRTRKILKSKLENIRT